jgi:hypothetical protein
MSEETTYDRRRFLRNTGLTLAAAQLAAIVSAKAQAGTLGAHTSFASLKQIDAGLLNIGYAEAGHFALDEAADEIASLVDGFAQCVPNSQTSADAPPTHCGNGRNTTLFRIASDSVVFSRSGEDHP